MLYIILTLAAIILQTLRNLEQKALATKIDVFTTSWSRFILPLPIAIIAIFYSFQDANYNFIFLAILTALMQIAGNVFLLKTLKLRNFSIGIAFYKTEVLQALFLSLIFFNEHVSNSAILAILFSVIGVLLICDLQIKQNNFIKFFISKATIYGLLCGLCFSISAFSLKFCAQELIALEYSEIKASVMVLFWVIFIQNAFFIILKISKKRLISDLKTLFFSENRNAFFKTSILSFCGSICWFIAYTVGSVVYVKAISQLELALAILISHFALKEKLKVAEIIGLAIIFTGISWLIFVI